MHRRVANVAATVAAVVLLVVASPTPAFADGVRDDQWHLDALGVDKAHKLSQGEGVTVGVIDSGIDASHPDLKGNIKEGEDFGESTGKGLNDASGHGTSVASLIVGHGHGESNSEGMIGIAPKAKVISAGIYCNEVCAGGELITDAAMWLVDQGVDVISISLSSAVDKNVALRYAKSKGVPVVASAGNDEPSELDKMAGATKGSSLTRWPANAPHAIPVSGTTEAGSFWDHSLTLKGASPQPKLGISAPAEDILAAKKGGGYATFSGTSGSAPIVAGTLALIKSAYPELTYEQVNERLLFTVDDKGRKGFDTKYGWGIVNPYRALTDDVKHYEGGTSTQDEIVPLEDQGKDVGNDGKNGKASAGDDGALAGSSGSLLTPILVAVAAVLVAAIVVILLVVKSRKKTQPPPPPGVALPMRRQPLTIAASTLTTALVVVAISVPAFVDEVWVFQWHPDALGVDKTVQPQIGTSAIGKVSWLSPIEDYGAYDDMCTSAFVFAGTRPIKCTYIDPYYNQVNDRMLFTKSDKLDEANVKSR